MATEPKSNGRIRFSGYELDSVTGELFRNGDRTRLDGQPLQVLLALLERPGELVTREELQRRLWPGDEFGDFAVGISKAVLRLREILHDDPDQPRFVETLPRRGYRFIAPVALSAEVAPAPPSRSQRLRRFRSGSSSPIAPRPLPPSPCFPSTTLPATRSTTPRPTR